MATARMTFTVPAHVKEKAQSHREVNWSAVVARAIQQRLEALETLEAFAKESRLTPQDVEQLAASMDRAMAQRLKKAIGRS